MPENFGFTHLQISVVDLGRSQVNEGILNKVHKEDWKQWESKKLSPLDSGSKMFELSIQVSISVDGFQTNASALIDTGCRIPLLMRSGLIPVSK